MIMKKNVFSWMTIMLMAFVCVGFAACGGGSDDDDSDGGVGGGSHNTSGGQSTGTFQGAKRVFGDNLVKVYNSEEHRYSWEFTYDANGFMTKAKRIYSDKKDNADYDISYSGNKITAKEYRNGQFHDTMTVTIGSNGFASKAAEEDGDWSYEFSYDNSGHLTRWADYDEGELNDEILMTWQNGDVVSGKCNDSNPNTYAITYEADGQSLINNDAHLADFDTMTEIHIDVEEWLIYSGAIGFGPAHLPIVSTNTDVDNSKKRVYQYSWEFDNQHRAISMKKTGTLNGNPDPRYTKVYTWTY